MSPAALTLRDALDPRLGRGEVAGFAGALEAGAAVGAVAEGLVFRVAAAAEGDHCPAGEAELLAHRVVDREVAFETKGTIIVYGYFGCHRI